MVRVNFRLDGSGSEVAEVVPPGEIDRGGEKVEVLLAAAVDSPHREVVAERPLLAGVDDDPCLGGDSADDERLERRIRLDAGPEAVLPVEELAVLVELDGVACSVPAVGAHIA